MHAWALLSTVMTEVLCKADWLKLWDHILSNSPPFFMFVLLAYFIHFREQIMSAETQQHMDSITRRCNPIDLNKVLPLLLRPKSVTVFVCFNNMCVLCYQALCDPAV